MSNSALVCYKKISPNRNSPRNHKIDTISIHCMAGDLSVEDCGGWMSHTTTKASANYGIGSDGRIGMYVEEKDRSWCTSDSSNDNRAITIEVANDVTGGNWHVSDKALASLIRLCADICHRNKIPKLLWRGDKSLIGQVSKQNMTVHRWFKNKACPGNYLYSKHTYIAKEVNKLLLVPYNPKDYEITGGVATDSTAVSTEEASQPVDINSIIDTTQINPYIATLSQSTKHIDCSKFKKNRIAGVMVYGGCYYDTTHRPRTFYRADNIHDQMKCIEKADLPYGIYVYVKAHSVKEAELECSQLWYLVSKYPPKLGVWLKLMTSQSVGVNNQILETYYSYIQKWGMKDLCGIYATQKDLTRFSWDKFYERFSLWLVDHVDSMADITNQVLTPELFLLKEE